MITNQANFIKSLNIWMDKNASKWGDQTEISKIFGISSQHLSNLLTGKRGPSEPLARRIAEKIGISYEEMTGMETVENGVTVPQTVLDKWPWFETLVSAAKSLNEDLLKAVCDQIYKELHKDKKSNPTHGTGGVKKAS